VLLVGLLVVDNSTLTTIRNSYATGQVLGISKVGGLIGFARGISSVSNSYSTGEVAGTTDIGGFLGKMGSDVVVSSSFWDTASANTVVSAAGTGLSAAQLKDAATFSAWDIATEGGSNNIWRIYDGYSMPLLRGMLEGIKLDKQSVVYNGSAHGYNLASNPYSLLFDSSKTFTNVLGTQSDTGIYSNQQGYDIEGAEFEITAKTLSLSGSRIYDGGTDFLGSILSVSGLVANENISLTGTAVAANKDTGSHVLDVTGINLSNSNYILASNGHQGIINAAEISLSGSRIYDGGTDFSVTDLVISGVITGEALSLTGAASIDNKTAGEQLLLTNNLILSSGNYQLKEGSHFITITPKSVHVEVTADDKNFDGLLTANISFIGSTDFVDEDIVALDFSSAMFASNQGTDLQVTLSDLQLTGADALNYTLLEDTALTIASIFAAIDLNTRAEAKDANDAAANLIQTAGNHVTSLLHPLPLFNNELNDATVDNNDIDAYKATATNDNSGIICRTAGGSSQNGANTGREKGVGVKVSDNRVNTEIDGCSEG